MCGIVGFTNYNSLINRNSVIKLMADEINHRGPDDEGYHISSKITLGHKRLSIIDLSGGKQPIYNENKSICVVFNGEIYNFKELKDELIAKGHIFKTKSDSEVLPHLYEEKGDDFPKYLNGMFAIALWDRIEEKLLLIKDRAGKKPIYYGNIKGELVFASELKSFIKYPHFKKELDKKALYKYLAHEYVPTPHSIFKGIKKLEAGYILRYYKGNTNLSAYWDYELCPEPNLKEEDIVFELDGLLEKSVKRRLISDVPLGVFLSGGIDSSALVYYMSCLMPSDKIKSFSIGFSEKSFDESSYARQVAKHFNTDHHQQILTAQKLLEIIPNVSAILDEPFADASIIPTYLLSKFTKEYVTVALGGDGGDELFMGYPTFQANKLLNLYNHIPNSIHKIITHTANLLPTSQANISFDFKIKQFLSAAKKDKRIREQLWLGAFSKEELQKLCPYFEMEDKDLFEEAIGYNTKYKSLNELDRLSYFYFKTYLHDDILYKVDRATMHVSLESRAPFLDLELLSYTAKIENKHKLKYLITKHILKKLLKEKLPKNILNRPKKGFGIPIGQWFKGPLKDLLNDTLAKDKIKSSGLFNYAYIDKLINEHISGKKNNRKKLWTLFMFFLWLEKWNK